MAKQPRMHWVKKIIFPIIILTAILLAFFLLINKQGEQKADILVQDLDTPWAIDFLPDGRMIFTERPGRVNLFDNGETRVIGNISTNEESESGLLGIAVDPEFNENHFIYAYYTHEQGNRVSRFTFNDTLTNELILLDGIPTARFHDGGRIKFGPDGKLYVTTGDATEPSSAQDVNSLAGKILRMDKDGKVPADNPFGNYAYSYGHRNPQGIAWHPVSKELYSSEHGATRNDEINIIEKGGDYGWPQECDVTSGDYKNPIICYSEFTLAPSGIAFHNNKLYIAGLRGAQLRRITLAEDGRTVLKEEEVFSSFGRIRDVVEHDGYLYIATSNRDGRGIPRLNDDKILKMKA